MIEVPIWFYLFAVIGASVISLLLILKFFIDKYAKRNTQNNTNNSKPLIMENTPSDTTKREGDKKASHNTPPVP
jgi:hypothetical protein